MARLLKTQKNDVYKLILQLGFNPSSFYWEARAGSAEFYEILNYKDHYSYFEFLLFEKDFDWKYRPGDGYEIGSRSVRNADWDDMLSGVLEWLENMKHQIEESDLWADLPNPSDSLWETKNTETENSPFTAEEHKIIELSIKEIREFVIESGLVNSEVKSLDTKLDYLVESSMRIGRKDWLLIVTGTLLGIVTSNALNSESAKTLFEIAGKALNQLYHGILYLPQ